MFLRTDTNVKIFKEIHILVNEVPALQQIFTKHSGRANHLLYNEASTTTNPSCLSQTHFASNLNVSHPN
jgi:hypothetical protein